MFRKLSGGFIAALAVSSLTVAGVAFGSGNIDSGGNSHVVVDCVRPDGGVGACAANASGQLTVNGAVTSTPSGNTPIIGVDGGAPVPVSGTVVVSGVAKGATAAASATVTAAGADHNAGDVILRDTAGNAIGAASGTPMFTKSVVLSDVFGRQSAGCTLLNTTATNASVALTAGRYRVVGLCNAGVFFRTGAVATVDGAAEWLDKSQSVMLSPSADTTLQAIEPVGSAACSPGIQACPRAE